MNLIRAFVACQLPLTTVETLRTLQRRLRDWDESLQSGVHWANPASFHLTLRFLGDIEEAVVPALGDALRRAVEEVPAFDLRLEGLGCFPRPQRARVLWAGVQGDGLQPLYEAVEHAVERIGLAQADRPFHPHLTLGRLKAPKRLPEGFEHTGAVSTPPVPVREVLLFSSQLNPSGAIHTVLRRAPLAPPAHKES